MNEWISVENDLPEQFEYVLVCREKPLGKYVVEMGYLDREYCWRVFGGKADHVAYWMPLPKPPEV